MKNVELGDVRTTRGCWGKRREVIHQLLGGRSTCCRLAASDWCSVCEQQVADTRLTSLVAGGAHAPADVPSPRANAGRAI